MNRLHVFTAAAVIAASTAPAAGCGQGDHPRGPARPASTARPEGPGHDREPSPTFTVRQTPSKAEAEALAAATALNCVIVERANGEQDWVCQERDRAHPRRFPTPRLGRGDKVIEYGTQDADGQEPSWPLPTVKGRG